MQRWATISTCGNYRYLLGRRWDHARPGTTLFIMLNPSTADAELDDPTIRRCISFATSWGEGGFEVVNLFAFRAAKPAELVKATMHGKAIGDDNAEHVTRAIQQNRIIVCAWGAHKIARRSGASISAAILGLNRVPMCLGRTAEGNPRHPLYVKGNTQLEIYRP